jgi:hypothetical protein
MNGGNVQELPVESPPRTLRKKWDYVGRGKSACRQARAQGASGCQYPTRSLIELLGYIRDSQRANQL